MNKANVVSLGPAADTELISLREYAEIVGITHDALRTAFKKEGVPFVAMRTPEGRRIHVANRADADAWRLERERRTYIKRPR